MIKDRDAAAKVLAAAFEASRVLDQSVHEVIAVSSPDEVTKYKRAAGSVMAEILFQIINPVIDEHPDLAPEGWR
jgi:hypothetical protein